LNAVELVRTIQPISTVLRRRHIHGLYQRKGMVSHRKSGFSLVRFRIALWLAAMLEISVALSFAMELALHKARCLALSEAMPAQLGG
jgi:hypothetical protein